MKRWAVCLAALTLMLALALCAVAEEGARAMLYAGNQNADALNSRWAPVSADADALVSALAELGAIPEGTAVRAFRRDEDGRSAVLDVTGPYGEALSRAGTAGEAMLLGSLVNTVLRSFELERLTLLCEGESIESGHNAYDQPLGYFANPSPERPPPNCARRNWCWRPG